MDKRLQEIIDNFDKMKIGIDDTFRFHCTQCGKCCINREDILLNPKDLFNLAKGLNISVTDVIKQYCEVYLGQDSRIPIVRLLPKGQIKRCPFLKDKKCSVHKFKPTVCATFPLGRVMTYSTEASMPQGITPGEVQYIFTDPGCGDNSETHTVREWLSDFDIALEDEFFMKWNEFISSLGNFIRLAEKKFLEDNGYEVTNIIGMDVSYIRRDGHKLEEADEYFLYRNAINIGLAILECPEASEKIDSGDEVAIDFDTGVITNLTKGETYQANPFPDFIKKIIQAGGLMADIKNRQEAK